MGFRVTEGVGALLETLGASERERVLVCVRVLVPLADARTDGVRLADSGREPERVIIGVRLAGTVLGTDTDGVGLRDGETDGVMLTDALTLRVPDADEVADAVSEALGVPLLLPLQYWEPCMECINTIKGQKD